MALTKEKRISADYYKLLPEGAPYQLIEGELIMTPAPQTRHQIITANIYDKVRLFTKGSGLCLFSPVDVYLDEENVFQPDIIFISQERLGIIKDDGIYGPPDLVVEILSPSTAHYDLKKKFQIYEHYGVKEYWIADPSMSSIDMYYREAGIFVQKGKAEGKGAVESVLLKGLRILLDEVF